MSQDAIHGGFTLRLDGTPDLQFKIKRRKGMAKAFTRRKRQQSHDFQETVSSPDTEPGIVRRQEEDNLPGVFDSSTNEDRCRANMAHLSQPRPDSGLGFQVNVL